MILHLGARLKRCPICAVRLKPKNIGAHLSRVHPIYSFGIPKVELSSKCLICGKRIDTELTKNKLQICNEHYVSNVRKFLVKDNYLKLKSINNESLVEKPENTVWMINYILNEMFSLLTWQPENISEEQYCMFSETSTFAGYLILRITETIPNVEEILYDISIKKIKEPTSKKDEMKINKLFIDMSVEFELFIGIKYASNGFFDIATDNEKSPKGVFIVPNSNETNVDNILRLRLADANSQWHGTFRKILVPYGTSSIYDENGVCFHFQRQDVMDKFEDYKKAWLESFGKSTKMKPEDFQNFWDWLKWVVSSDGFTTKNTKNALHFDDFKQFGLSEELVFELLNQILFEPKSQLHLISNSSLVEKDPDFTILNKFARLSRAFKFKLTDDWVYFIPCREWFPNTIMPSLVKFSRDLNLAGTLFENYLKEISDYYGKSGISKSKLSSFGPMIEPKDPTKIAKENAKTSKSTPWKIFPNVAIKLPTDETTEKIGTDGEIDLIILANMNLYLIELKALNLTSKESKLYLESKAPKQCAKYSYWIKNSPDFTAFLDEKGITENDFKSVRILICSSGGSKKLFANCEFTNEKFAIVPEFIFFSVLGGFFTLSLKKCFPERVESISPALKIVDLDKRPKIMEINLENELRTKIAAKLGQWNALITFDRKRDFSEYKFDSELASSSSMFETTYVMHEMHLEGNKDWVLKKPVKIGEKNGYSYYFGTQTGNAGSTLVCENCKSVLKYYSPADERDQKAVEMVFTKKICPFCENTLSNGKNTEIVMTMSLLATKFKKEHSESWS